ncbi:LD-carboxypeptidase [Microcoleus sp. T2B6]|uniref:S66 peptidase family protein n=1 Tax=Microcoleus sp. T2B6 TaxID=3055424 RepID=UPI002FD3A155
MSFPARHIEKLKRGDRVAILSPSFGAPGAWPHVYQLGLERLQNQFGLKPIEFSTTTKVGASPEERAYDLIAAFEDSTIKAVVSSIGGDDQVTYVKKLPPEPFIRNPKPFFGFSDNTHFMNFLWLHGVPSYYGGAIFTQFAMQVSMDEYTVRYLKYAMFEGGKHELLPSTMFNDIGLNWNDPHTLTQRRVYEPNDGWFWNAEHSVEGITWGGCLESIDDILRHGNPLPSLEQFRNIILMTETSEEIPSEDYVFRVYRALGERGILERIRGVLVGRPKGWEFNKPASTQQKKVYRYLQREAILKVVRRYNIQAPVVQNMDFGHTDPQVPMPYGSLIQIDVLKKKIFAYF